MELKLLEPTLRSRLRSGVAIASVSQCVGELVENSIDAGATCIAVRVDITKFKVQVVDNGNGLSYDDLCLVGKRYMTSKCHTVDDISSRLNYFGYRGEAIASIVDVSGTVEICSRHRLSQNTYSKIFHNGKAMPVTAGKSHRPSVGTTASVHDFFYNLPVRKRGISAALELEQVKRVMESIALMNPSVSFSIRNDATGECVLQTHKTNSVMSRFGLLFGGDKTTAMKDVSLSQDSFELSGFMSTEGHHNKSLQFIYINGRIVKKTPLHSCINNMLANSLLTRKLSRAVESSCHRKDQESVNELFSPRRTQEVFGVYVLHIMCPRSEYDICLEPAKTLIEFKDWDRITAAVEELVRDFLFKNNLTLAPILPAAANSLLNQQEDHQRSTSSMISEKRSDISSAHLPTSSILDDLTPVPSLQSMTIRRSHHLTNAGDKQGYSCLPQSKLCVPGVDMTVVENKRVETPRTGGDGGNHTDITTVDAIQEDLLNSSVEDTVIQPNVLPHVQSESRYHGQECGEQYFRSFNCLPTSTKLDKQATAFIHEANICDAKQQTSVTYTMSPTKVYSKDPLQYPSSSSFFTTYSCVTSDSTYTPSASAGQLTDASHKQKSGVDSSSKDSSNIRTCALFKSSMETSNTQNHSPLTHILYRSPLQSSISSKLSKMFKSKPKKNELRLFSGKRKANVTCRYPPPTSLVPCQSVSLESLDGTCNAVAVNLDANLYVANSRLLHGEEKSLPQSPPLTLSVANTSTSSCISKPEYSCNSIHPIFSSAPAIITSVPTVKHSQVSTTSALVGHPLSLGVYNMPLMVPSKSATSCHEAARHLCTFKSSYDTSTDANQSLYLASSDTGLIDTLDSEMYVHLDNLLVEPTSSCVPVPETSRETAIPSQEDAVEDERRVLNTDFIDEIIFHSAVETLAIDTLPTVTNSSSTTESAALVDFDSKKTIWKEVTDPATGRMLYMHSKSGNCVSSLPLESSTSEVHSFAGIFSKDNHHDSLGCGSLDNLSSTDCSSSIGITNGHSICLDTELSRGVFDPYCQKPDCHRISLNIDRNSTSKSDLSISSLLADHQSHTELLGTKWRHQSELNEISSIRGYEMADGMSFDDIFKEWKNPTFQGGEETILRVGDRNQSQIKVHSVINRYKFSQEIFSTIKVLGQVDNKFIACLLDSQSRGSHDLLVMIDQHAAHERVRLEALLDDLYVTDTSTSSGAYLPPQIRSSTVHPPLAIKLQPGEVSLARSFHYQFKLNGLSLKFSGSDEVLVTSLPSVFMEREASEVRRGRPTVAPTILKDMIIKQIEATCGVATSTPETILNVLSSQACHGAIKFGDTLTLDECKALILSLSKCKLPFQCAHGRPSLVPILDLHILNKRYPTLEAAPFPSLSKLGQNTK